jgi:ABC-2 type transport system ATP-binding protein
VLVAGVPQELVEQYKNDADVLAVARRGQVTLEDVFIGLTGRAVRA